jgi:hypothetical protein
VRGIRVSIDQVRAECDVLIMILKTRYDVFVQLRTVCVERLSNGSNGFDSEWS